MAVGFRDTGNVLGIGNISGLSEWIDAAKLFIIIKEEREGEGEKKKAYLVDKVSHQQGT